MKHLAKLLVLLLAAASVGAQSANVIVAPKVAHKDDSYVQHVDTVTRSCPPGYEAHYVDQREGFDMLDYWKGGTGWGFPIEEGAFTICFDKKFMDTIRKNPELSTVRPQPPRGV